MIQEWILNQQVCFHTTEEVFSPSAIDPGTLAMLSIVEINAKDKVLDLGCGYGVVGITLGKILGEDRVVMCDASEKAIALARENAAMNGVPKIKAVLSDGFQNIEERDFTLILSNPPYHADFSVPKRFIEEGFHTLLVGGKMMMVTKRKEWYKNKLASTFGGVEIYEIHGYFVFVSEKRSSTPPKKKKEPTKLSKKLQRKMGKR